MFGSLVLFKFVKLRVTKQWVLLPTVTEGYCDVYEIFIGARPDVHVRIYDLTRARKEESASDCIGPPVRNRARPPRRALSSLLHFNVTITEALREGADYKQLRVSVMDHWRSYEIIEFSSVVLEREKWMC